MKAWPLVGRVEELADVAAALSSPHGPRGVVLAGAAGVGKTRLAREATAAAGRRGFATRWVTASESARGVPLAAFAPHLEAPTEPTARIVGECVDALVAGSGPAGLVVGIDDAHLLDSVSALVVQQLLARDMVGVIVTIRSGEPPPDAVTALWKDESVERIELEPFSENEIGDLLTAVLGGPVDSLSLRALSDLTLGNALYLRLLVEAETRAGHLLMTGDVWHWSGHPVIPPALIELVVGHMGLVDDSMGDAMDLLAICEPLSVSVLEHLIEPAAVETAEARGLVSVELHGASLQARLAHPLYGEVRRMRLGKVRARRLRGELATALADSLGRDNELLRRAVLSLDSDLEPDPELLSAAALSACRLVDLDLAVQLARAGIAAGAGFELRMALARTLSFQDRSVEAETEFAELATLARNETEQTVVAFTRAGNLLWPSRRPDAAGLVLDAAESSVTDDGCRRLLASIRACTYACNGQPDRAAALAREVLGAEPVPAMTLMTATIALACALGVTGRADQLAAVASRGYSEAERSPDVAFLRFPLAAIHVRALAVAGYVGDAEEAARSSRRMSAHMPGRAQFYGLALEGRATLARGKARTAVRRLREARAGLTGDRQGFGFICLLDLSQALALAGESTAAREAFTDLEANRHPAFAQYEPEVLIAHAWTTAAEAAVGRAIELAHQAAAEAVRVGQVAHEVLALHTAARLGDRSVADRLCSLADIVDGPLAPVAAAHASALAVDDGEALAQVSIEFEEMGDLMAAADAVAHAASAFASCGRAASAAAAGVRAQRLADDCEQARTPALIAAAHPLPLTPREREVVTLAAQGLSSRQIAERLFVSVRTVEGHLYNAAAKLGTSSRADFAARLAGR